MAKQTRQNEPQVFEQAEDEAGRMRLDRPFTPEEAAAADKENLARLGERAVLLGQFRDERPRRP